MTEPTPVPGPLAAFPLRSAPPVDVVPPPSRWRRVGGRSSWILILLGAWLLLSIFLWPHTQEARLNTWLIGVLMLGFGALSLYKPWVRWLNAVLAVWLGISAFAIAHVTRATVWHDVLVALAVLGAALSARRRHAGRPADR